MNEIPIKLNLEEIVRLLESLSLDSFDLNKELMQKIMKQVEIPMIVPKSFWDRAKYFTDKLIK